MCFFFTVYGCCPEFIASGTSHQRRVWNYRIRIRYPTMMSVRSLRASKLTRFSSREKMRSEEHTSELQSRLHLVCRLLLEKKKHIVIYDDLHLLRLPASARPLVTATKRQSGYASSTACHAKPAALRPHRRALLVVLDPMPP